MEAQTKNCEVSYIMNSIIEAQNNIKAFKIKEDTKITNLLKKLLPEEYYNELLTYLTDDTQYTMGIESGVNTDLYNNQILWIKQDIVKTHGTILVPLPNHECFRFQYTLSNI